MNLRHFLFSPVGRVSDGQICLYLIIALSPFYSVTIKNILNAILNLISNILFPEAIAANLLSSAALLAAFLVLIGFSFIVLLVKRAHDLGKQGAYILLCLIPIIGFYFFMKLIFARGDRGDNAYGRDPLEIPDSFYDQQQVRFNT